MDQIKKAALSEKIIAKSQSIHQKPDSAPKCLIGFDGFTDEIIDVVDKRERADRYTPLTQIAQLGQRLLDAAGQSCNLELVVKQKKIGGNAPIMTRALLEGGHRITFVGNIGLPAEIEPIFQEMANRCEAVYTLGPSAHTDALEFHDGKIIMGKLDALKALDYASIMSHMGKETFTHCLDSSDLFVCANWTMLPMMTELWEKLPAEIIPGIHKKQRMLFVDLADPAKRTDADLKRALKALKHLKETFTVILGLNSAEAHRISTLFNISPARENIVETQKLAEALQKQIGIQQVVIHATRFAVVAAEDSSVGVEGPYCSKPLITTGAGDHFNAGYCNALLYGLTLKEALLCGVSTSGYYVRTGQSPTMEELAAFLIQ